MKFDYTVTTHSPQLDNHVSAGLCWLMGGNFAPAFCDYMHKAHTHICIYIYIYRPTSQVATSALISHKLSMSSIQTLNAALITLQTGRLLCRRKLK